MTVGWWADASASSLSGSRVCWARRISVRDGLVTESRSSTLVTVPSSGSLLTTVIRLHTLARASAAACWAASLPWPSSCSPHRTWSSSSWMEWTSTKDRVVSSVCSLLMAASSAGRPARPARPPRAAPRCRRHSWGTPAAAGTPTPPRSGRPGPKRAPLHLLGQRGSRRPACSRARGARAHHQHVGRQLLDGGLLKRQVRRVLELDRNLGRAARQPLAGAQIEGRVGPAPVVDLEPDRDEGLRVRGR